MIRHQAIAVEPERVAQLGLCHAGKEGSMVIIVVEDDLAIIAAIDRVINQPVFNRSQWSSHA